ncbi:MAG: four-helix bundle copper-binding protein, partial [Leeuwenhoekiella sp.]
ACLSEDNIKMMVNCIRTDRACAEVCSTTAKLLAGNYVHVNALVAYCQSTCEKCAEECGKHEHQHCKDCAEACSACAEACAEYLA